MAPITTLISAERRQSISQRQLWQGQSRSKKEEKPMQTSLKFHSSYAYDYEQVFVSFLKLATHEWDAIKHESERNGK